MDGHHSHNTPKFKDYCDEKDIITIYLPPHASHLLQPLDVSCFSPLKREYGKQLEGAMRKNTHYIVKEKFIELYIASRPGALSTNNIKAGFQATGLEPFDPSEVLSNINALVQTPSPSTPSSIQDDDQCWMPETPHSIDQLKRQTRIIRKRFKKKTILTPSPTNQGTLKVAKSAENSMYERVLAREELVELRAEVKELSKLLKARKSYIGVGRKIARDVVIEHVAEQEIVKEDGIVIECPASQRRCRQCKQTGHNSRTCSRK